MLLPSLGTFEVSPLLASDQGLIINLSLEVRAMLIQRDPMNASASSFDPGLAAKFSCNLVLHVTVWRSLKGYLPKPSVRLPPQLRLQCSSYRAKHSRASLRLLLPVINLSASDG